MSSRRLLALLCTAVLGVLAAVGLLVFSLLGPIAGVAYVALAAALLAVGAVRSRRLLAPPSSLPAGRTCTCCTTTHFDPVRVIE